MEPKENVIFFLICQKKQKNGNFLNARQEPMKEKLGSKKRRKNSKFIYKKNEEKKAIILVSPICDCLKTENYYYIFFIVDWMKKKTKILIGEAHKIRLSIFGKSKLIYFTDWPHKKQRKKSI